LSLAKEHRKFLQNLMNLKRISSRSARARIITLLLNELSEDLKKRVLVGLRDCAFDLHIFEKHQ